MVYRVNGDSPMIGVLRHRDAIVSVDEVYTSSMSATEVTVLIAKRIQEIGGSRSLGKWTRVFECVGRNTIYTPMLI